VNVTRELRETRWYSKADLIRAASVCGVYALITIVVTWPLARHVGSRIGGDATDPWQTLWGFWWWRHSTDFGDLPMHSRLLWWPDGISLWPQTWDIPSAIMMWPFWSLLPEPALYNVPLLLSFPLSGFTCYLLCRALWGGTLGPALAGAIYTFSTYHFGHANACLHIASMQWSPLYFLGLVVVMTRPGYLGWVLVGLGLSLATLTSIYHLVFCATGTIVLVSSYALSTRVADLRSLIARQSWVAAAIFAVLAGWLVVGLLWSYVSESYIGAHPGELFSADLQSFFVPNAVTSWSDYITSWKAWPASRWSGATKLWANASYLGYVTLILAACAFRVERARPYLLIAVVGAILALGPHLQIGGTSRDGLMPYGWLTTLLPFLNFSGLPSRFAWLTLFGCAVAACAVLNRLCDAGARGRALAIGLTLLALIEVWPKPLVTSSYPRPAIFAEWAKAGGDWAVLDATWWSRALWHQTLHRHPIVGGYVTRYAESSWKALDEDPVLSVFFSRLMHGKPSTSSVSAAAIAERLLALNVRFVVLDATETAVPQPLLPLVERYRGDGIVVYENVVQLESQFSPETGHPAIRGIRADAQCCGHSRHGNVARPLTQELPIR
jgi:hypothetical protein